MKRAKPDAKSDDFGAVCRPGRVGGRGVRAHAPGVGTKVNRNGERKRSSVIIDGSVYDLTSFLPDHPGGKKAI